ncbi:MAG: hypothetical protein ACXACP_03980 [Candidatus Hodarchaeales archaeon]|jgi:hypothetical protein
MEPEYKSLLDWYRLAATGKPNTLTDELWGYIPSSFNELKKMAESRRQNTDFKYFQDNLECFRKLIIQHHRKLGTLNHTVKESIERLENGLLDVGHQPLLMGGSVFLMNKVSLAEWIGNLTNLGTLFYIGDHDFIQNELTVTRFPQANSASGLTVTPSSWEAPEGTPIHQVPLPSLEWLLDNKNKIQNNLILLMKYSQISPSNRQLLNERFLSWWDLVYEAFISTDNFSMWTQKIWSNLFIIKCLLNLFMIPSSNVKFRSLVLPAFEFLLIEENRNKYVDTMNSIFHMLNEQNISPGLPYRNSDYVPFFLECLKCKTKTRIELTISLPGTIHGSCSVCNEEYSFSYDSKKPDLSEIGTNITPRSDSRAVANSYTLPIFIHVGGGGETQYYSAVIPAMKKLDIAPPVLIRSNRIYYNTPWGEKSATESKNTILSDQLLNIFKDYNKAQTIEETHSSLESMRVLVERNYSQGNIRLNTQKEELKENKGDKQLRNEIRTLETMLSQNHGQFAPGKKVQEVSWNWLDLAILTGLHRFCESFKRQNRENSFPGYTWFINPGKFT